MLAQGLGRPSPWGRLVLISMPLDLTKLIPKLPDFTFRYPDLVLGLCFVLAGLVQGITPTNPVPPFGFGLISLSMSRQRWHFVGAVRQRDYPSRYKVRLAWPSFVAGFIWSVLTWTCFRVSAQDFHVTEPFVRWLFHY